MWWVPQNRRIPLGALNDSHYELSLSYLWAYPTIVFIKMALYLPRMGLQHADNRHEPSTWASTKVIDKGIDKGADVTHTPKIANPHTQRFAFAG